jgi:hypothetical protein
MSEKLVYTTAEFLVELKLAIYTIWISLLIMFAMIFLSEIEKLNTTAMIALMISIMIILVANFITTLYILEKQFEKIKREFEKI